MDSTTRARALRLEMTPHERILWKALRGSNLGHTFRRQQPMGRYIVDFVCLERKLVVEVDGSQHRDSKHDLERDRYIEGRGFRVLRFWNSEVTGNLEGVLERVREALGSGD